MNTAEMFEYAVIITALENRIADLEEALVGAEWIIQQLVPHEVTAILIRGYKPSAEVLAQGAKYRTLIDATLEKVKK